MNHQKRFSAVTYSVLIGLGVLLSSCARSKDLSCILLIEPAQIPMGASAAFMLQLTNMSKKPLVLRPDGICRLTLQDRKTSSSKWMAEIPKLPAGLVNPNDLIVLQPHTVWKKQIWPTFRNESSKISQTIDSFPVGTYTLRAEYICDRVEKLSAWEGHVISQAANLTVTSLTAEQEEHLINSATPNSYDEKTIADLGALDSPRSVETLLYLFQEGKMSDSSVIEALARSRQPGVARRVMQAIMAADDDHTHLLNSPFAPLIEANARCEDFDILLQGKLIYTLRTSAAAILFKRCSNARQQVTQIIFDEGRKPRDRAAAIELLGHQLKKEDFELYRSVLDGKYPTKPFPPPDEWNPLRQSVIQGLFIDHSPKSKELLEKLLEDQNIDLRIRNSMRYRLDNWDKDQRAS